MANWWLPVALLIAAPASAAPPRSKAGIHSFKLQQPCPSTGQAKGPCPGWIVDHITPLCAGGADAPANMQWQTVAEAKAKDREEARQCREMRRP